MTDKKDITSDLMLSDLMLRVTALESLLIEKKILSKEEIISVLNKLGQNVMEVVKERIKSEELSKKKNSE